MALILTRKKGESIQFDDDVIVTVDWIRKRKVRFLVKAPETTRVVRAEIVDQPAPESSRERRRKDYPTPMLILVRKQWESIRIGDDVILTVDRIDAGRIQVAIIAPTETIALRTELLNRPPSESQPQQKATA
ncbi:carbon storage regulator [Blastopirellula retiformator]|uniref:Translational regulator CsrA n=1 Tax=Blastopirellula retiformator TaxID=2527970 RepID=A0A5C5VJ65_9BACT|nr:carbon storage regulator [Blastopirellula retiformator]TWT38694.1 hypothetical protein Enr8_03880 [Blastopirellula retiformator]